MTPPPPPPPLLVLLLDGKRLGVDDEYSPPGLRALCERQSTLFGELRALCERQSPLFGKPLLLLLPSLLLESGPARRSDCALRQCARPGDGGMCAAGERPGSDNAF